jgi:hypothetical protein
LATPSTPKTQRATPSASSSPFPVPGCSPSRGASAHLISPAMEFEAASRCCHQDHGTCLWSSPWCFSGGGAGLASGLLNTSRTVGASTRRPSSSGPWSFW